MKARYKIPYGALAVAVFATVVQIMRLSGEEMESVLYSWMDIPTWQVLYHQPWRILTSVFLHHNVFHLLENVGFLLLLGYILERQYGWKIVLSIFFGAVVTGYVLWITLAHGFINGLSGGVYGLFGFSLIANRRSPWWKTLTASTPHLLYVLNLLWALAADAFNLVPFTIAHLNHVGGFFYGIVFGWAFTTKPSRSYWRVGIGLLPIFLFASQFYSPWQVEWRMVRNPPQMKTPAADCQVRSEIHEIYEPSEVTFVNNMTRPIAIYWLDYEGAPQFQFILGGNASHEYFSFLGHPFCVVDVEQGKALKVIFVTSNEQTFNLP